MRRLAILLCLIIGIVSSKTACAQIQLCNGSSHKLQTAIAIGAAQVDDVQVRGWYSLDTKQCKIVYRDAPAADWDVHATTSDQHEWQREPGRRHYWCVKAGAFQASYEELNAMPHTADATGQVSGCPDGWNARTFQRVGPNDTDPSVKELLSTGGFYMPDASGNHVPLAAGPKVSHRFVFLDSDF